MEQYLAILWEQMVEILLLISPEEVAVVVEVIMIVAGIMDLWLDLVDGPMVVMVEGQVVEHELVLEEVAAEEADGFKIGLG